MKQQNYILLEHIPRRTTQNISDCLKDIGELSSIFYLHYHFGNKGWSVYRNYDEKGYDILLFNHKTGKKIKIEVKTRQKLISSASNRNRNAHFTLTELERKEADYLIGLWFEYGMFFIVPTSKLSKTKARKKILYKYVATLNSRGEVNPGAENFLDNWDSIINNN